MNRARLSAGPPEPHWLPGPLPQGPEGQAWARRGKDRRCWVFLLPPDGAGRTLDGMKSLFFPMPQRLSERDGAPRWSGPTPSCAAPTLVTDWGRAGACQQGRTSSARKRSFCRKFWHSLSLSRTVCLFTCARTVFACCPMLSCRGGGGVRGVQAVTHGGGGCPWLLGPQRQIHSVLSFPFSPPDLPSIPCVFQLWRPGCPHQLSHARFETLSVKPGP